MKHERFTVLGSAGFIGSRLLSYLRKQGHECVGLGRGNELPSQRSLGHVIYCVGVTADFRTRPFETTRAHVCALADVLEKGRFESLLYLSSTRIYANAARTKEDEPLVTNPTNPEDFYNLTKLTGEALCLACERTGIRVVRLSNVFGDDFTSVNFLPSVIRDAVMDGHVTLQSSLDSEKDYVSIEDVVRLLPEIAIHGRHATYNLASGANTTTRDILETLSRATGCTYTECEGMPKKCFPLIDISRLKREFQFDPKPLLGQLSNLVEVFRKTLHDKNRS